MKSREITLGFSPCPNDTFIFEAIINHRLNVNPFRFQTIIEDVETLNKLALKSEIEVLKVSAATYPFISSEYLILNSGSALGLGVGPLLVSRSPVDPWNLHSMKVAVPGLHTTANLLLSIFFPQITNKEVMIFSNIEQAVADGRCELGLLIHEGRFTYKDKGLTLLYDLGVLWESNTGAPLPLGFIVASRRIPYDDRANLSAMIRDSILFAMNQPGIGNPFIHQYADEMDDNVIRQHIELYVNNFSLDLGHEGREAVTMLFKKGEETGLLPKSVNPIFNSIQEL